MPKTLVVVASAAGVVGVALAIRAFQRSKSPIVETKLSCPCGKTKGTIRAKYEDSARIHCFCGDCRAYQQEVFQKGGKSLPNDNEPARLCQICKSDLMLENESLKHVKLACKNKTPSGTLRFYADCCHVPLFFAIDGLGSIGVYEDLLEAHQLDKFHGPVGSAQPPGSKLPPMNIARLLWIQLRYFPYRHSGPPIDYHMEPSLHWGIADD